MRLRPRLVCIPSDDAALTEYANALLDELSVERAPDDDLKTFVARLHSAYPTVVVRERHGLAEPWPGADPVWYVTKRAFASRIRASFEITAPRERVFDAYVKRMPEWHDSLRLRAPNRRGRAIGIEYEASYKFLGVTLHGRLRVVDATPPTAVRVEAEGSGVRVWYVTTFRSTSTGTRLEVAGDYVLPTTLIPATVERLVVERRIAADIERAHAALLDLCLAPQALLAAEPNPQPELAPSGI